MNFGVATGDLAGVIQIRETPSPAHLTPNASAQSAPEERRFADIAARVASAVVLVPFGLGAALAGGPWIAAATGAAVVAMSFEWARMSERGGDYRQAFMLNLAGSLGAVMFASRGHIDWALYWLALCALAAAVRPKHWKEKLEAAIGACYVGAPCALFVWLRGGPAGLELMLFLFTAIWAADVFAYLGGTLLGGPRLHPALSPNKTWAGIAAGVIAGGVGGGLFGVAAGRQVGLFVVAGAFTALVGLGGDLLESQAKRRFGVKDASGLIPGHGGVLDRIDGLMMATVIWSAAVALAPLLVEQLFWNGR